MAAAVDPTYPLYPIACFLAAAMLLLVLMTSFVRQSWNLGVAFLCFWLLFGNLANGSNAIIWSDNANIKLYVYCDIVTRVRLITSTVAPMATLIIARRLYLIANLQTIEVLGSTAVGSSLVQSCRVPPGELNSPSQKRRDLAIEWVLGLVIPVLVAGPLYYVVQYHRLEVKEGFGYAHVADGSVLSILLTQSGIVVPPFVSITVYYPRVALVFYRQGRDIKRFMNSNNLMSRTNYMRILALASVDLLLTLPTCIATVILFVYNTSSQAPMTFYSGWEYVHLDWDPVGVSYAELVDDTPSSSLAQLYFGQWTYPILSFVIFSFFGVTSEARA
ncbi:fungal pheromone STE3G-protein-coupled receptor [Peniophora sp. CONT]|nr:fungal pheromone STE3G-protein-coupled receptor [Peniophora sp. CONT]